MRGRVVSARDGEPLIGVEIRSLAMSSKDRRTARRGARAVSGPDGRFEIAGLTPGPIVLRAFPSRGLEGFYSDVDGPVVESGEIVEGFELKLEPSVRLRGKILDRDGAPLAGARVSYRYSRGGGPAARGRAVQTGDSGEFEYRAVPSTATILLTVHHDAYACATGETMETGRSDVSEVVIQMSPGATLRGRLVDPAGRAVPEVMVAFASSGPFAGRRRVFDRTDSEGRFVLGGLPRGPGHLVLPDATAWKIASDDARVSLRSDTTVAVTFEVRPVADTSSR